MSIFLMIVSAILFVLSALFAEANDPWCGKETKQNKNNKKYAGYVFFYVAPAFLIMSAFFKFVLGM